jgi:hypothetical protein
MGIVFPTDTATDNPKDLFVSVAPKLAKSLETKYNFQQSKLTSME